jgi:isoleucyl-tRNA synthetase
MRRVPEVIDVWWDAGSMPFAQWGYPHVAGSAERLAAHFPADFISEAIDQTRGWFYALLAINNMLFGPPAAAGAATRRDYPLPFRTCIVLGHMMGEDGLKMSKRLKNYKEPSYIFDQYGADAMRWYFYSAQAPWTTARFQEANIRDAHREFLVRLYNVFGFFVIYANLDGFEPGAHTRAPHDRSELDRWIRGELHRTIRDVRAALDRFENYPAARRLNDFVDALSNWWVRRSRPRFWMHEKSQDKWDAYETLYECLLTLSKLVAPFTPHFAETMYQTLTGGAYRGDDRPGTPASVHLCDYPAADEAAVDEALADVMDQVRDLVSAGRAARTAAKLKVRQPLAKAEIIVPRANAIPRLQDHVDLIAEELNLKSVEFTTEGEKYVTYSVKPDFKALGPRLGKLLPKIGNTLAAMDPAEVRRTLAADGAMAVTAEGQTVSLTADEVQVRLEAKPGWSAAPGRAGVVVVSTELTPELIDEGKIRELIHFVQAERKTLDLPYEAHITLSLDGPPEFLGVVKRFEGTLRGECLVDEFAYGPADGAKSVDVEGHAVQMAVAAR